MGTTAAIYTRISLDLHDGAGVARQEQDCRDLAEREGLTVSEVYSDNSVSAFSGVRRPGFERLLADVSDGSVGTVIVWATDRLYRRMTDLELLVNSLGEVPVLAVKSGEVNLATADGRVTARLQGVVAQHSSEKTGERVAAAARQRALDGRSGASSRPFGWERLTEGGLRPHPEESGAVAACYSMLLTGHNLSQISRWLTSEGFTGTRGGRWTQSNISALLRQPRHGGLVQYQGRIIDAANTEGALVDADTWRQAQRILTAPGRKRKGPPAKTALTGLMRCYKCGGTVRPSSNQSRAGVRYKTYSCNSNHVSWRRSDLDAIIRGEILTLLADGRGVLRDTGEEQATEVGDPAVIDRLRRDRDGLARLLADGTLSLDAFTAAVDAVEARIVELTPETPVRTPSAVVELLDADDIAGAWDAADFRTQRQILAAFINQIIVHPKRTGQIDIDWKTS